MDGLITHPALIRVVVDYIVIALKGEGTIILGDAPIQSADFSSIVQNLHLDKLKSLVEENSSVSFVIEDFRREITVRDSAGKVTGHHWQDDGDFVPVNLWHDSFLDPIAKDYQQHLLALPGAALLVPLFHSKLYLQDQLHDVKLS